MGVVDPGGGGGTRGGGGDLLLTVFFHSHVPLPPIPSLTSCVMSRTMHHHPCASNTVARRGTCGGQGVP